MVLIMHEQGNMAALGGWLPYSSTSSKNCIGNSNSCTLPTLLSFDRHTVEMRYSPCTEHAILKLALSLHVTSLFGAWVFIAQLSGRHWCAVTLGGHFLFYTVGEGHWIMSGFMKLRNININAWGSKGCSGRWKRLKDEMFWHFHMP